MFDYSVAISPFPLQPFLQLLLLQVYLLSYKLLLLFCPFVAVLHYLFNKVFCQNVGLAHLFLSFLFFNYHLACFPI